MSQMYANESNLNELSRMVIGGAFTVLNALGAGFIEKVYENALAHELRKAGLAVEQQRGLTITYNGIIAGEYVTDLIVENAWPCVRSEGAGVGNRQSRWDWKSWLKREVASRRCGSSEGAGIYN